jgi:threonine aldolase
MLTRLTRINSKNKCFRPNFDNFVLHQLPFIKIELEHVETNIILLTIEHEHLTAADFEKELAKMSVRVYAFDRAKIRIVMHFDIGLTEVEYIKNAFEEIGMKK